MNLTTIGGIYLRTADPDWADPLDTSFSLRNGGRWNAPGSHASLYLNADETTARANVQAKFAGLPYGPEDLDPADAPHLVQVSIADGSGCELRTDDGLTAAGLPVTYPEDDNGDPVPWDRCQAIGARVFEAGHDGIACRSAAPGGVEELAWFPQPHRPGAATVDRVEFPDWYWPGAATTG